MLSVLNEIILQTKLQKFMTNKIVLGQQSKDTITIKQKANIKIICSEPGIKRGISVTAGNAGRNTHITSSSLTTPFIVSI